MKPSTLLQHLLSLLFVFFGTVGFAAKLGIEFGDVVGHVGFFQQLELHSRGLRRGFHIVEERVNEVTVEVGNHLRQVVILVCDV